MSQAEQKSNKVLLQNHFTQTHLTVLNMKNCTSKLFFDRLTDWLAGWLAGYLPA